VARDKQLKHCAKRTHRKPKKKKTGGMFLEPPGMTNVERMKHPKLMRMAHMEQCLDGVGEIPKVFQQKVRRFRGELKLGSRAQLNTERKLWEPFFLI